MMGVDSKLLIRRNKLIADTIGASLYVFHRGVTPRSDSVDDELTVAEVNAAVEEFKAERKYKPVQVGATRNPKKIEAMRYRNADTAWSILCEPSGLAVVNVGPDVDLTGLPGGVVVSTAPNGDRLCFFSAGDAAGNVTDCIAPGSIDAKGRQHGTVADLEALRDAIVNGTLPELIDDIVKRIGAAPTHVKTEAPKMITDAPKLASPDSALLKKSNRARWEHNAAVGYALIDAGIPVFVTDQDKTPLVTEFNSLDSEIGDEARRDIIDIKIKEKRAAYIKERGREPVIGRDIHEPRFIGATLDKKTFGKMMATYRNLEPVPGVSVWPAGLAVVDVDERKYPGAIERITQAFDSRGHVVSDFPNNPTRSGGLHIYTMAADDSGIESNNVKHEGTLWGDVKGKTQVIAPGAVLATGQTYGNMEDLHRLCEAYKAKDIPTLPQFVADMIGTRRSSESNSVSEREIQALKNELWPSSPEAVSPLPDVEPLLDPARGGFDMPKIAQRYPKLREAIAEGDKSDIIFDLAGALKAERADTTAAEFAAIVLDRDDCGEFADNGRAEHGISFNRRTVARAWLRSSPLRSQESVGDAFDSVSDDGDEVGAATDAEQREDKRSKMLADITTLEMDVVKDSDGVVFDEPGAEESLRSHKRQLKQKKKELERHDKSEAERAEARSGFIFSRDFDNYRVPDDRIEDMIPSVGTSMFVGDSNVGKTFALLEMVRCLESGEKYLGHNVESCGAMLVTGEGFGGLGRRLAAMRKRWPGVDITVNTVLPDFGIDVDAALRKLKAMMDEYEALRGRAVRFLALDNLLLMSGPLDANKAENARAILKPSQDFARAHDLAIVIAAHENRSGKESGSYAWRALVDNMMFVKRKQNVRFITGDKERDGPADGESKFKLKVIGLGENKWRNPVSSCVVEHVAGPEMPAVTDDEDAPTIVRPDRLEHRLQDVLDVFEREGERQKASDESTVAAARRIELAVSEIQASVNARRKADGLTELSRSTVNGHVKAAVEKGDLESGGTAARPLYKLA